MIHFDRVLRILSTVLSIYFLVLGLRFHDRASAGIYIFPGLFWIVYYWIFLREIVGRKKLSRSEVATVLTWFIALIVLAEYTFFIADNALHFAGGLVALIAGAFFFPFKKMKSIYSRLISTNEATVLLIFSGLGATSMLFTGYPVGISYFTTFIAVGFTIYSWNARTA